MASERNGLDAKFESQVFRKDHPMVIATNRHLATIYPVRLAYDANGYKAGQVLALTTDNDLYKKFSVASGTADATCVLFEDVSAAASSGTALARGIFGGEVFQTSLIDYNSDAKGDLGAREVKTASGTQIVKF